MSARGGYSTPLVHAAEIETSIRFHGCMGFSTIDTDRCQPLGWARLRCGGAVKCIATRCQSPASIAGTSADRAEIFALVTSTTEATMIALPIRM